MDTEELNRAMALRHAQADAESARQVCCRPTSSGSDIDPGNLAAIKSLRAQVARLEGEKAAMAAALMKVRDGDGCCSIELKYDATNHDPDCPLAALSGEGKVWQQVEKAPHYDEDGKVISEAQWRSLQTEQQAEDDLADRATDMPRYDGD